MALSYRQHLSTIEEILEDARKGKMMILVDEEDREDEGDLLIPAEVADAEAINFMAKCGRGLICLALTGERVRQLGLPLMARQNLTRHQTAFTVSIDAREGVATGISAADRAQTVAVAIDPTKGEDDIITPGHVFPLVARDGGVLVRAGHTEAAVDVARLAGFNPSGVICEVMNDDGTMARLPDLVAFSRRHGVKIATIADLIAYRRRYDTIVERELELDLDTICGGRFRAVVYINKAEYAEHLALVKGEISGPEPVLVRVHAFNVIDDVLGDRAGPSGVLRQAVRIIDREGRGVVVLIREPRRTSLSDYLKARMGEPTAEPTELRDIGVGAQILLDLGVRDMVLLTNSKRTIVGLDGYGLKVVDRRPISLEEGSEGG
ncbi:MAG: 3,4-dihydroxy-2-butanone-4-phosphate synthase [Kiloniellales bacterium]